MWQHTRIRNSNYTIYKDFNVFVSIARAMKGCHYYYICKENHKLYGCDSEGFGLHVIDIPEMYEIPKSIYFGNLYIDNSVLAVYNSFIVYDELPWLMLPLDTIDQHHNYRLVNINEKWEVIDSDGTSAGFLKLYEPELEDITVKIIYKIVMAKLASEQFLGPQQIFGNQQTNPVVRTIFDNKVSIGRRYLRLTGMNNKNYGMMIFKSLFNLNKDDTLTIIIRDRLDYMNTFEASFITAKKKSSIPNIIPFFTETVYATFLNM